MPKYLSLLEWKRRSSFSPDVIEEHLARIDTELGEAVGTYARFEGWEGDLAEEVDNTLRRRYVVPLAVLSAGAAPDITKVPRAVKGWMARLLDEALLDARRDAGEVDPDDGPIRAKAQRARDAMGAAADPDNAAHPELPLRSDLPSSSGVELGGPFVVEYNSAFDVWDALVVRRNR